MLSRLDGDLQLGADTVGGGDQDRVLEASGLGVKKRAKAAETGGAAGTGGGFSERLDGLDQRLAGVDIDACIAVGQALLVIMRGNGLPRGLWCGMFGAEFGPKILDPGRFAMSSLRRLRVALIFLAFLLPSLAVSVAARAADAYAVRGIDTDVTAAGVAAAKEQAIAEAERVGFRRLLERLTIPADHIRLPNADAIQYVRDVAIEHERSSSVRYIATLTVRYNATAVKKLLRDAGLKYAEPRPRPVVLLPLYKGQGPGKAVLWDDPNPWRAAWTALGTGALVPLAVPTGDTADLAALPLDKVMAADTESLSALGARYHTSDVLVATAGVNAAGTALDVSLTGPPGTLKPFEARTYPFGDGGLDATLRHAAADIAQGLDNSYKQQNLLSFDRAQTLAAMAPLSGLEDWLAVRERLGRVPQIRRWEIISLSREEAALMLHTVGETEQVRAALSAAGLNLEWTEGFWTLRTGGRK
ncbi:conserved hypothetical protein [Candidatus Terasakiella magnetica]|nr:conserved hypothetical protein [Candidatus Terasakiella magnetica]